MSIGKLSTLQERVLRLLADIEPRWTLTGGAALAGFHTHHRATRDLNLFFRPQAALGTVIGAVREHLERGGRVLTAPMREGAPQGLLPSAVARATIDEALKLALEISYFSNRA